MADERTLNYKIDFGADGLFFAIAVVGFALLSDVTDDKFGNMGDAIACGIGGPQVCRAVQINALEAAAEKAAKRAAKAARK